MDFEKKQLAYEHFKKSTEDVTTEDVEYAVKKGRRKIEELDDDVPEALGSFWQDIKDMWSMLVDYWNDTYPDVPWKTIASIVGALIYLISPIDVIPDFIPVVGYLDDAAVIGFAMKVIGDDLDAYRKWKKATVPKSV